MSAWLEGMNAHKGQKKARRHEVPAGLGESSG
jgi:hypothetical protein